MSELTENKDLLNFFDNLSAGAIRKLYVDSFLKDTSRIVALKKFYQDPKFAVDNDMIRLAKRV